MPVDIPTLAVFLTALEEEKKEEALLALPPLLKRMAAVIIDSIAVVAPVLLESVTMGGTDLVLYRYDSVDSVLRDKPALYDYMFADEIGFLGGGGRKVMQKDARCGLDVVVAIQMSKRHDEILRFRIDCAPVSPSEHDNLVNAVLATLRPKPFSEECANPVCKATAKDGVKLKYCRGCRGTHYCSDACQKKDRAEHRKYCSEVKAIVAENKAFHGR